MKRIPRRLYVLLVLACSGAVPAHAKETRNIQFSTPFKHVVVIFQENRTPDNLFQGLCHPSLWSPSFMQQYPDGAPVQHLHYGVAR